VAAARDPRVEGTFLMRGIMENSGRKHKNRERYAGDTLKLISTATDEWVNAPTDMN
jgi:hypothetical protein